MDGGKLDTSIQMTRKHDNNILMSEIEKAIDDQHSHIEKNFELSELPLKEMNSKSLMAGKEYKSMNDGLGGYESK
jgi:hypothetical protein